MKRIIDGETFEFCDRVRDDRARRLGFDALAGDIFHLDFEAWFQGGWWSDCYVPHTLYYEGRAVSNVSANLIRVTLDGKPQKFVQLGTVMTDPGFRGRGLSRFLMENVIETYMSACDGIYLYANDSVLAFYPKFGFSAATEYGYFRPVKKAGGSAARLDMARETDRDLLLARYRRDGNPFSACSMIDNEGLIMFYLSSFLKDNAYFLPQYDAVAIAEHDGSRMLVHDLFGGTGSLDEILSCLALGCTATAELGFTPKNPDGFDVFARRDEDTTLFVLDSMENPFEGRKIMFPLLSHA